MKLVVDASVAVKWFLRTKSDEQHRPHAENVLKRIEKCDTEFLAPAHWIAEVIGVLTRVDSSQVEAAISFLTDMRPRIIDGIPAMRRAANFAIKHKHHIFDTLYYAVALETGATLVTADERYFAKARGEGLIVMLQDFKAPA